MRALLTVGLLVLPVAGAACSFGEGADGSGSFFRSEELQLVQAPGGAATREQVEAVAAELQAALTDEAVRALVDEEVAAFLAPVEGEVDVQVELLAVPESEEHLIGGGAGRSAAQSGHGGLRFPDGTLAFAFGCTVTPSRLDEDVLVVHTWGEYRYSLGGGRPGPAPDRRLEARIREQVDAALAEAGLRVTTVTEGERRAGVELGD